MDSSPRTPRSWQDAPPLRTSRKVAEHALARRQFGRSRVERSVVPSVGRTGRRRLPQALGGTAPTGAGGSDDAEVGPPRWLEFAPGMLGRTLADEPVLGGDGASPDAPRRADRKADRHTHRSRHRTAAAHPDTRAPVVSRSVPGASVPAGPVRRPSGSAPSRASAGEASAGASGSPAAGVLRSGVDPGRPGPTAGPPTGGSPAGQPSRDRSLVSGAGSMAAAPTGRFASVVPPPIRQVAPPRALTTSVSTAWPVARRLDTGEGASKHPATTERPTTLRRSAVPVRPTATPPSTSGPSSMSPVGAPPTAPSSPVRSLPPAPAGSSSTGTGGRPGVARETASPAAIQRSPSSGGSHSGGAGDLGGDGGAGPDPIGSDRAPGELGRGLLPSPSGTPTTAAEISLMAATVAVPSPFVPVQRRVDHSADSNPVGRTQRQPRRNAPPLSPRPGFAGVEVSRSQTPRSQTPRSQTPRLHTPRSEPATPGIPGAPGSGDGPLGTAASGVIRRFSDSGVHTGGSGGGPAEPSGASGPTTAPTAAGVPHSPAPPAIPIRSVATDRSPSAGGRDSVSGGPPVVRRTSDGSAPAGLRSQPPAQNPTAQIPATQVAAVQIPAAQIPAAQIPAAQIPAAQVAAGQVAAGGTRAVQHPATRPLALPGRHTHTLERSFIPARSSAPSATPPLGASTPTTHNVPPVAGSGPGTLTMRPPATVLHTSPLGHPATPPGRGAGHVGAGVQRTIADPSPAASGLPVASHPAPPVTGLVRRSPATGTSSTATPMTAGPSVAGSDSAGRTAGGDTPRTVSAGPVAVSTAAAAMVRPTLVVAPRPAGPPSVGARRSLLPGPVPRVAGQPTVARRSLVGAGGAGSPHRGERPRQIRLASTGGPSTLRRSSSDTPTPLGQGTPVPIPATTHRRSPLDVGQRPVTISGDIGEAAIRRTGLADQGLAHQSLAHQHAPTDRPTRPGWGRHDGDPSPPPHIAAHGVPRVSRHLDRDPSRPVGSMPGSSPGSPAGAMVGPGSPQRAVDTRSPALRTSRPPAAARRPRAGATGTASVGSARAIQRRHEGGVTRQSVQVPGVRDDTPTGTLAGTRSGPPSGDPSPPVATPVAAGVLTSAALAAPAPGQVIRRKELPAVRPAAVPVGELGGGSRGGPGGPTSRPTTRSVPRETSVDDRQVIRRSSTGHQGSPSGRSSSRSAQRAETVSDTSVQDTRGAGNGTGGSAEPSTSARLDQLDAMVAALEDRILDQLDRRGGRFQGVW